MTPTLAGLTPRALTHSQAAAYCSLTLSGFDAWVSRGLVPGAIPGTKRWDKRALDHALDLISNLPSSDPATTDLDEWRRKHANAS